MKLTYSLLPTLALFSLSACFAETIYREVDGQFVIEPETAPELGNWILHSSADTHSFVKGFSGTGVLQFNGNKEASGPADSPLSFNLRIDQPGTFVVMARGLEAPLETKEGDKANDCYIRVVGQPKYKGEFTKFVLLGDSFQYSWRIKVEAAHHQFESAVYSLSQGVHQLEIAGRSKNFFLDRIVVYRLPDYSPEANAAEPTLSSNEPAPGSIALNAISDFELVTAEGKGEFYVDINRRALAVNAAKVEFRAPFSAAETVFKGKSGTYDVEIRTLTELDGESPYQFSVNGTLIGRANNTETTVDYRPSYYTWRGVALKEGDTIQIQSKPHTNKKIPEGDETAWSRGRWTGLTLIPSK